jgi:plastocyanin
LEDSNMSRYAALVAIMVVGTTALVGCPEDKGDDKPAATTTTTTATAPPAATMTAPPAPAAPTGNGTVTGVVTITGKVPVMADIAERKGDPVCAKTKMSYNDVIVDKKNDLKDVLVRLAPGSIKGKFPAPSDVMVEQKDCMYVPHTVGIQSGGSVIVKNADKTTHNVHTYKGQESQFNQGQPPGTPDIKLPEKGKTYDEGVITFKCDIHKWMAAYGVVTDHPYFTVTGDDGTFKLDKLPAGKYKLEAWHSQFGSKTVDIEVVDGKPTTAPAIVFNADTDKRSVAQ